MFLDESGKLIESTARVLCKFEENDSYGFHVAFVLEYDKESE